MCSSGEITALCRSGGGGYRDTDNPETTSCRLGGDGIPASVWIDENRVLLYENTVGFRMAYFCV